VNYLISQGVARERLTARGYGPDRPRESNATEDGRAANRRIEFNVSG
jgi:outer membrane protein OmpA-like peptidoglycan-associated protein